MSMYRRFFADASATESQNMAPPLRSQSFRHRSRPPRNSFISPTNVLDAKRYALEEISNTERRRSTPTISRRCSLQKNRIIDRTDVWPEPKQMSEIEERFLKLPDSEDYTRVRQFKIDAKGAVVSRGDSFRRKRNAISQSNSNNLENAKNDSSRSPFALSESDSLRTTDCNITATTTTTTTINSRSTSVSSSDSSVLANKLAKTINKSVYSDGLSENASLIVDDPPSTSHPSYKVFVLGQVGSGKTSLVNQFITSEYRNAFADDIECESNTNFVSVNIGGFECDLTFFENDPQMSSDWKDEVVDVYVLVYSIDRKSSFRTVVNALEDIREKRKSVPIILAGNKIDLERRRAISPHEVKCVALTYNVVTFEISVALNHDVDDLLVGIVAATKESVGIIHPSVLKFSFENSEKFLVNNKDEVLLKEPEEFRAAIRRFSQRKKRQMGGSGQELDAGKCPHLSPIGLIEKFRQWRRGMSQC